jgi:hypothetical protein
MMAPMISNCDRPREPPPSVSDACQKRRNEPEGVQTKTSKLEFAA